MLGEQEKVAERQAALTDRELDTKVRKPADAARYQAEARRVAPVGCRPNGGITGLRPIPGACRTGVIDEGPSKVGPVGRAQTSHAARRYLR
ncbi:hypothetical protein [Streptomyces sp. NPDC060187]|uniref:hypothetical protein n=1 Tax=Streptomyces sp. NPDC060187 TaxID=3347067 RepID=UPI0036657BD9